MNFSQTDNRAVVRLTFLRSIFNFRQTLVSLFFQIHALMCLSANRVYQQRVLETGKSQETPQAESSELTEILPEPPQRSAENLV
ncbi:hypothetical protein XELAEV_18038532mg [Xenopus laevis]|uniref:Uncharacterized protein n=1 Tax=Xenopus laevis TaxID=8355 RepID=A0A974H711_XENLA|nr:hypothetical protein XELAEV_18038532mg [Xenopus laevis]